MTDYGYVVGELNEQIAKLKQERQRLIDAIRFFKENENTEKRGVALRQLWEVLNEV